MELNWLFEWYSISSHNEASAMLRRMHEACSRLDKDRDACLRLYDLLRGITTEFKRIHGPTEQQRDSALRERYLHLLQSCTNALDRSYGILSLFYLRHQRTVLQELSRVYKRLKELLEASDFPAKSKWLAQCEKEMQVIADDLCIERMVLALSDGSDAQKASAARVLEQLAFHTPIRRMIGRAGAIGPLLALVKTGTEAQKCYATYTLRNLTIDCQANCSEMVKQGAIPVLVELLKSGDVCHKRNAVFALVNLSNSEEHNAVIVQHNGIEHLITLLQKGTGSEQRIYAAQVLANLSAESASHRAKIARHGAIPILGRLVFSGSNEMKSQAAVALGNLARRNAYNCVAISKTNAIEPLVTMLRGSEEQKTAAVKALELINYYSDACHAEMVEQGAVPLLWALVLAGTIEQQRTAGNLLLRLGQQQEAPSNLVRRKIADRITEL